MAGGAGRFVAPEPGVETVREVVNASGALHEKTRRALDSTILDNAVATSASPTPRSSDVDGDLLAHLGPPGLPITVALDGDGRVAGMHVGQLDNEGIEELLAAAQL